MTRAIFGLLALMGVLVASSSSRAAEGSPIGRKIDSWSASDFRGKTSSLVDFKDSKLVVVAFLGTECPLAKLYGPRLVELAAKFEAHDVAFVGVDSNQQDSMTELAHYARQHNITFPLLKDTGNVIADQFGAVRTPEIFVLDQQRTIRYWGRVDDQFGFQGKGVAYQRSEPTREDLRIALDELLAHRPLSKAVTLSQGCHIGRVKKPSESSQVTYSQHIAPIFNANCVFCHRKGQIAPFPLTNYEQSVGWAEMVREVVNEQRMPPWHADPKFGHFKNDARLSDRDKELINEWVDNGAPEGDPADMPPAPQFAEGWQIPKPDQVLYMADEPYAVPANGTVEYQRFVIDPGWTEDKWVQALECVPGNPAVVHHIIVYLVPPGVTPTGQAGRVRSNWLGAFAPGLRQQPLPDGLARYVQAGSKLMFEMHYTANGTPQKDRSYVGLIFADPKTVKKEVAVQNAANFTFKIPPHDDNYAVEAEYAFHKNSLLLSVSPHMHLRGKDFLYEVIYPDGKTETVLSIPHYDFGWQTTYELAEPKLLPRGTKMRCVAHFDNSADNLANPDPNQEVAWGEQTWEEMMFGWFEMALADQDLTQPATAEAHRVKEFLADAASVQLDDQLQAMARGAMADDKAFERCTWQLFDLFPQLDRVCVTSVIKGKLRLVMLAERPGLKTSLRNRSTVARADGQSLAAYALGDQVVVNDEMGQTTGSVMAAMASKDVRSSMHVPVTLSGERCTINFWSAEAGAFPPAAATLLEQVARLIADGSQTVAQK